MKLLYTCILLFVSVFSFAQCVSQITVTPLGLGSFNFTALNPDDTTASTSFTWVIESDTIHIDSVYSSVTHHFDSNGTYNIQLTMVDTTAPCLFDTVWQLVVEDADYVPLLDSVNIWHYRGNQVPILAKPTEGTRSWCNENTLMFTSGDTTINGYTYKKLFYDYNMYPGNPCLWGYIREDVSKGEVYTIKDEDSVELKLYDFSMQIGDTTLLTFKNTWGGYFTDGMYRLDSIKPFEFSQGVFKREFFLNKLNNAGYTLRWVEGIGNLGEMLYLYSQNSSGWSFYHGACPYSPHDFYKFLICFEHKDRIYFDSCARENSVLYPGCVMYYDTCQYDYFCGGISKPGSITSMEIFPNPAHAKIVIELDVTTADDFEFTMVNLQGSVVSTTYNAGRLGEGKRRIPLMLPVLASGLYMLECRTKEGAVYKRLVVE